MGGLVDFLLHVISLVGKSKLTMFCNLVQVPNDSFGTLLERFSNEAKLEGTYFFCRQDGVMQVAKLLEKVDNLSLEDR